MNTKQALSMPVIAGVVVAVVVVLGFLTYKLLLAPPPTYGSGGVAPPCYGAGTCGKAAVTAPAKP